ncbi:hypothetical protein ACVWYN_003702 [Pedobacter sp. UYP24]
MDKIVVFASYYDLMEAHIIKSRLMDSGIDCFLVNENVGGQMGYNQATGGVMLQMFERDVEKSRIILTEEI